ncbi:MULTISPECIES: type II toxin-antitoxin system Phd/YefM family antitoxin [Corynebacterium]|uniref:type II toxin-antitoxin system Phd/YefM family antitoxin n=1 Tax=Corynebacterium TaxID=1716 RepID=UPI000847E5E7|nr:MULTISPECIES: type II toxin-antitoxin system Phd/YefM family antitoxin [Corynebacterium]ODQ40319.1 prevent-host-death protein [Corynebacterium amycolatum]OFR60753.1 prevent-host-death protein [Corynebacterium sp. HMSC065H09]
MAIKKRKVPMRHINIGDLSRGQASRLIKEVADKDEPAYVLRYGKPIAVVISNERYERLMSEGIDPSEH